MPDGLVLDLCRAGMRSGGSLISRMAAPTIRCALPVDPSDTLHYSHARGAPIKG